MGCWFAANTSNNINLNSGDNFRFVGCTIRNAGTGAPQMVINNVTDVSVIGNFIGTSGGASVPGIAFTGSPSRVVVKGNTFLATSVDLQGVTNVGALSDLGDNITDKTSTLTAAAALTIPPIGKVFLINGTTPPTSLTLAEFGRQITLWFNGSMTINNSSTLVLAGGTFTVANGSTLTIVCVGTNWLEIARKA